MVNTKFGCGWCIYYVFLAVVYYWSIHLCSPDWNCWLCSSFLQFSESLVEPVSAMRSWVGNEKAVMFLLVRTRDFLLYMRILVKMIFPRFLVSCRGTCTRWSSLLALTSLVQSSSKWVTGHVKACACRFFSRICGFLYLFTSHVWAVRWWGCWHNSSGYRWWPLCNNFAC